MQAVSQRIDLSGAVVTTVEALPAGRPGTVRTLALMRQSVLEALDNAAVLTAAAIAAGMSNRASSAREEIRRLQLWVQQSINYVLDPQRVELLQSPELTLERRAGDCDDHTALVCALLSVLGYPARIVAIGFQSGLFAHVYSEALINGRWTPVETIKPWPLGKSPSGVVDRIELPIAAELSATPLQGLFSAVKGIVKKDLLLPVNLIKNPKATIKGQLKEIVSVIPAAASGFAAGGPWGALAGAVVGKVQYGVGQYTAAKQSAAARQAYDAEMGAAGQQIADAIGQPSRADEFASRLKSAKDPAAESQKIIGELQASGATPKASAIPGSAVASVGAQPTWGRAVAWIEANKTTATIIGGVAAAVATALLSASLARGKAS